jgi:hypothetical protein
MCGKRGPLSFGISSQRPFFVEKKLKAISGELLCKARSYEPFSSI